MLQALQDYEATIQALASECHFIAELGIQVDKLFHTFNGHEEYESQTHGHKEQIWEVEINCEEDNVKVCDAEVNPVVLWLISSVRKKKPLQTN